MPHKRTTAKIFHRAKALRRALTPAERKLWKRLRDHQLNGLGLTPSPVAVRFAKTPTATGEGRVGAICPERKYIIELDGDTHANQVEYDAARTDWLQQNGWQVLRFTNRDIEHNLEGVLKVILETLTSKQS